MWDVVVGLFVYLCPINARLLLARHLISDKIKSPPKIAVLFHLASVCTCSPTSYWFFIRSWLEFGVISIFWTDFLTENSRKIIFQNDHPTLNVNWAWKSHNSHKTPTCLLIHRWWHRSASFLMCLRSKITPRFDSLVFLTLSNNRIGGN